MKLDPTEVVDYIEASNNVIELQKTSIEELEKSASDKDTEIGAKSEKIQKLEKKLTEQEEKVAQAQDEPVQEAARTPWGTGQKQEVVKSNMRDSEKKLYERFGVPIN